MRKPATPKQRVAQALKFLKAFKRYEKRMAAKHSLISETSLPKQGRDKTFEKIAGLLRKPLAAAFKRSGLDNKDQGDRDLLLTLMAWAIYSKDPGQPKSWTKEKLRQLLADFTKLRAGNPSLTEADCCDQLIMDGRYIGVSIISLRRRLQDAKKLNLG